MAGYEDLLGPSKKELARKARAEERRKKTRGFFADIGPTRQYGTMLGKKK